MKHETGMNYLADAFAVAGSVTQSDNLRSTISWVLTIIATLISIGFTLFQLYNWWKEAKKDGKITKEEIDEAQDIINGSKNCSDINKKEGKTK